MVSPKKKQKISHETTPEHDEQGFQNGFDKKLNSMFGDHLNTDKFVNDFHSWNPNVLPLMTAKVIHQQFLLEGYDDKDLPSLDELVRMINEEL